MKQIIDVHEYDAERGIITEWEEGSHIMIEMSPEGLMIRANAAGMRTLAQHFLVLAQDGLPDGAHVHLDDFSGLAGESEELMIERLD